MTVYKDAVTNASARTEDHVADCIFRGLGFKPGALGLAERALGASVDPEMPKLQHAREILNVVSHGAFAPNGADRPRIVLDVRDMRGAKDLSKWIDRDGPQLAEDAEGLETGLVCCVRGVDAQSLRAVVFANDTAPMVPPWLLQPGALLYRRFGGVWAWVRGVKELFSDMRRYLQWDQVPGWEAE